ncbi:MAG: HlyD family efflux transporter periplasmic adaptor subunit, partial [Pseudomonadota bacterium]
LIVPSRWLGWMRKGHSFKFEVDELGRGVPAKIVRIGRVVDAVSQTVKVYAELTGARDDLGIGMSGTAIFAVRHDG